MPGIATPDHKPISGLHQFFFLFGIPIGICLILVAALTFDPLTNLAFWALAILGLVLGCAGVKAMINMGRYLDRGIAINDAFFKKLASHYNVTFVEREVTLQTRQVPVKDSDGTVLFLTLAEVDGRVALYGGSSTASGEYQPEIEVQP